MENCEGCVWLDTSRPPRAIGYCMNTTTGIDPMYRARYNATPRCDQYTTEKEESEVVNNG